MTPGRSEHNDNDYIGDDYDNTIAATTTVNNKNYDDYDDNTDDEKW